LPGYSPLDNAVEQARRCPLRLRDDLKELRSEGYQTFVSIAGWLQVGMGDANILLPVEELAPLLRVKPMTVSRYRRWAVEDGFIKEVKPYQRRGENRAGKATEFRFNVERFPILGERAADGTQDSYDEAGQ
jgi:hypothetical protein